MKRLWITAAVGTALLVTGCQVKEAGGVPSGQGNQPTILAESPKMSPSTTPTPTPMPTVKPNPTPVPIQKTYKVNKNYDIVPIDPTGDKKVVFLSFDDGPKEKEMIDPMIDVLDKHKAKAVFFVNGYRIQQKPELLKLIHDRGQIIGNHSWDHINLKKEGNEKIDQQIADVQKIVKELTGTSPEFFRPPYGSWSDHVKEKANKENMLLMTWSNGSLDWDQPSKLDDKAKGQAIIDSVMKQLRNGSNILMHELPWTVKVLDELLTKLEEKGYSFVDPRSIDTTLQP